MLVDPKNQKEFSRYLAMSQAGLEMVVPIGIGLAVDWYWKFISPWGVIVGAVLGFGGGLTHLIFMSQKNNDNDPPSKPTSGTP